MGRTWGWSQERDLPCNFGQVPSQPLYSWGRAAAMLYYPSKAFPGAYQGLAHRRPFSFSTHYVLALEQKLVNN